MAATWLKEPASLLDWVVDWSPYLADGETITAHTVTPEAGITLDSSSATNTAVTVWLDGGTLGETYTVTVQVTTSGGRTDRRSFTVAVRNLEMLNTVKDRLGKTLSADDGEVQDMIDAALVEYEMYIGPVSGTVTETLSGGGTSLILPHANVASIDSIAYTDGTSIDTDDLDLQAGTGILYWRYGTAGYFTAGSRNVTVTYTVGALPANHREVIVADVAGYFAATQRGGGSDRPQFPGEGYAEAFVGTPQVLFPRIRALAASIPVIA